MAKAKVECEYLSENLLCKAVEEGEGKTIREKSCSNSSKQICCYVCDDRKSCRISCVFLDRPIDRASGTATKASIAVANCDYCGAPIRKGDDFVVAGKYPNILKAWYRARWTGIGTLPEDHGEIYHPPCYLESLKKNNAKQRGVQNHG